MNFADAVSRVAEEDERRNDQNRERRQKVRALYSRFKSGLEGSGLKFAGGDHETDETIEVSLLIPGTFPQQYIRVIAHDIGAIILQRRDQTGRPIRQTESGDTIESVMKALVRLTQTRP